MAANKFASMLHRNTNKITLILIYAVLEWTLIILLLLNSLFAYLIIKFANYFGLKPPCPWCSSIDHFFEPKKNKNFPVHLLCNLHATEISKLGYCSNHQKLAFYQDMCEDCSSSRLDFHGKSQNFSLFSLVKEIGMIRSDGDKVVENYEVGLKCSCCGVSLKDKMLSPYFVINPSWGVMDYTQKGNLITEVEDDVLMEEGDNSDLSKSDLMTDCFDDRHMLDRKCDSQMVSDLNGGFGVREEEEHEDCSVSVSMSGLKELDGDEDEKVGGILKAEKEVIVEDNSTMMMEDPISDESMIQVYSREDASLEILPQHLEFFVDCSGHRLVPVELIDSIIEENQNKYMIEEDKENSDHQEDNLGSELHVEAQIESIVENRCSVGEREAVLSIHENIEEPNFSVIESMEMEETDNSIIFHAKVFGSVYEEVAMTQATQTPSMDMDDVQEIAPAEGEERDSDILTESEEVSQIPINESETEVSIGTEIPDLDSTDEIQSQDNISSHGFIQDDPSPSSDNYLANNDPVGTEEVQEETVELKALSVDVREHGINHQLSLCSEINEIEEEKIPDTPTSIESLHHLHKKLLLLEREGSGTEESLDGSVISEFQGGDGVMTVERLTSALRAERKNLHALYAELEEERSASAVAANQTMAMINRLQEEKASMQMEALQYQRMMEEQSEYDQEALQLMNELMVKREKEKQELEKELEVYTKKVLDYEAKQKMRMLRRSKDGCARSGTSSASCSNAEDSDELSLDLNQEAREEDSFYSHQESGNHNTPVDEVLNLEDSLADFEEERVSILEQLKVLEEKLFTMTDEEEQHFEVIRPIEHFYEENGEHLDESSAFGVEEVNGVTNGFSKEINGKHHQDRRIMGSKAKQLLPLFDAISTESEDGLLNGHENGIDSAVTRIELDNKRLGIDEEVDQLYERLQSLEADREFLKHCIGSLKKGDKGMNLLQEILQHLRDLRNVELRERILSDGALV